MKNKQKQKFIVFPWILLLILLFFVVSVFLSPLLKNMFLDVLVGTMLVSDEIQKSDENSVITIFNNSKSHFEKAKNTLSEFQFSWEIKNSSVLLDKIQDNTQADYKVAHLNNKLRITIQNNEYFDSMQNFMDAIEGESSVKYILNDLDAERISSNSFLDFGCIYFSFPATWGHNLGIIYCPEEKPQNPYLTKLKELDTHWFYFEE